MFKDVQYSQGRRLHEYTTVSPWLPKEYPIVSLRLSEVRSKQSPERLEVCSVRSKGSMHLGTTLCSSWQETHVQLFPICYNVLLY